MARVEKTVFISYRRKDVSWALAVYQDLTHRGYDVFFDYTNIPSGDFEQIILSNIKARAHFVLILTPTALDRCSESGDWLRREIELAIDEKRNIVPLFFDGFNFGNTSGKLTGKLQNVSRYNGMNVHQDYFLEAMERLRNKFLNVPLNTVLHPVSIEVQEVVEKEQYAANKAVKKVEKAKSKTPVDWVFNPKSILNEKVFQATGPTYQGTSESQKQRSRKFIIWTVGLFAFVILTLFAWKMSQLPASLEMTQTPSATKTSFVETSTPTKTPVSATSAATIVVPTPTLGIGSTMISEKGETLVYVPAGEFTMGDDSSDAPVHTVYLDAFWIDQTEVTNKQYQACVDAGTCEPPSYTGSYKHPNYYGNPEFDNYPVLYVNWDKANRYCEVWKEGNGDLPTEAQWEKAARGTDARTYPWGNDAPNSTLLNYNQDIGDTTEVGKYPSGASIYGVYDMAGNVWEWVNDRYDEAYYKDLASSSNPLGPNFGDTRLLRGGAWDRYDSGVRSAVRLRYDPGDTVSGIGFRCVLSP